MASSAAENSLLSPTGAPETVRSKKKPAMASTQRYLPIAEIKEDTLVLKNGGLRAVLRVNSLNFNLKSEVEQQGIIAGYQAFVNTLIFPVQILIRSTRLNIDPYIKGLQEKAVTQENPLLKEQTLDYADFMAKIVDIADIMQKSFYIIVPLDALTDTKRSLMQRFMQWLSAEDSKGKALERSRSFRAYSKILRDRVTLVQSGLENIGITMRRLKTDELVQLFYSIYNPLTCQKQKFNGIDDLNVDKSLVI
jgi:hypothetical protein